VGNEKNSTLRRQFSRAIFSRTTAHHSNPCFHHPLVPSEGQCKYGGSAFHLHFILDCCSNDYFNSPINFEEINYRDFLFLHQPKSGYMPRCLPLTRSFNPCRTHRSTLETMHPIIRLTQSIGRDARSLPPHRCRIRPRSLARTPHCYGTRTTHFFPSKALATDFFQILSVHGVFQLPRHSCRPVRVPH